jgi:lysophospholipase L1-like esterase
MVMVSLAWSFFLFEITTLSLPLQASASSPGPKRFHSSFNRDNQKRHSPIALQEEFLVAQKHNGNATAKGASSQPIVIIGASYAKSWPLEEIHGVDIVNRGVAGEQSSEMLSRFRTDVVAAKPSHVIIWGFINDIFRSEQSELESKLEVTKTNFEQMVQISRANQIIPILATEITIRPPRGIKEAFMAFFYGTILGKSSYQTYVNNHVEQVNQWIRDFAAQHHLTFLDFEAIFAAEDGYRHKAYATIDGSHISGQGYEVLTQYTNENLYPVLKSETVK